MGRIRTNFVKGTILDDPLISGATTLTSVGLADLPEIAGDDYAVLVIDPDGTPEIVYVTAHTAGATTATILRGQEGTSASEHALNTTWVHGPTAEDFGADVITDFIQVTSGNVNVNSTVWATLSQSQLSIPAKPGDYVEYEPGLLVGNQATELHFDVAVMVGGSMSRRIMDDSSRGYGGWFKINSEYQNLTGPLGFEVQPEDIEGGVVTLRLAYKTGSATNRELWLGTDIGAQFKIRNYGPIE